MTRITKLDRFCRDRGIETASLARHAKVSRKHVTAVRKGRVRSPGLDVVARLVEACGTLAEEVVGVEDIFETDIATRKKAS
jgi:predicted transcriptional regulator